MLPLFSLSLSPQSNLCTRVKWVPVCAFWRFFPCFTVLFASKLAIFPLICSNLGARKGHFRARKGQMVDLSHVLASNWAKNCNKTGEKRQKAKWYLFRAPTSNLCSVGNLEPLSDTTVYRPLGISNHGLETMASNELGVKSEFCKTGCLSPFLWTYPGSPVGDAHKQYIGRVLGVGGTLPYPQQGSSTKGTLH